jgi:hypothetical protein
MGVSKSRGVSPRDLLGMWRPAIPRIWELQVQKACAESLCVGRAIWVECEK